ncbi:MAG: 2-hydroxyacyl-CoA dehydratase subunit D, partial [Promethearchaeota archaeon]
MSKVKKTNKMLNATNKLKNEMGRHFLAIEQAYREGKPTAWTTAGTPVELLYSMGVQPMLPENSATVSAALKKSQNFIELAEDQGYSYDLCSYFKTNVGAVISNAEMSEGGTRKPTFMLSSDVICDTHVNWFQVQSERMGDVPHFTIDIPHVVSNTTNRQKEYFKNYIKEQLWELLDFITEITGYEYDVEKAREVAQNSYEMGKIWQNVFKLRKNIPCPVSTRDTFGGLFPLFTMTGLKSPIKLYNRMYKEANERVKNGIGALEKEEFRLAFLGIPFWYNLRFFSNLERWNAIICYETYVYAFSKYTNPDITRDMVIKNPVESMAELILSFWYIYDLQTRFNETKKMVKEWNIDGVLMHSNLSCRPNACNMYDLNRKLMDEADIPCLIVDADMNDPR